MPTYEYICYRCKNEWEEISKISDPPQKICPECKEESAKRLISKGTGFQLLGNCWAKDGYKG